MGNSHNCYRDYRRHSINLMKRTRKQKPRPAIEVPMPRNLGTEPGSRMYHMGKITVILSQSHFGWHISISHPTRYPRWDEIADARYALIPDEITMGMILPPKDEYVNLHSNVFHLWEINTDRAIYEVK